MRHIERLGLPACLLLNLRSCEFTQRHVWLMKVRIQYNITACFTTSQPIALLWHFSHVIKQFQDTEAASVLHADVSLDHSIPECDYCIDNCASCLEVVSMPTPDTPPSGSVSANKEEVLCTRLLQWELSHFQMCFRCRHTWETMINNLSIQSTYRRPNTANNFPKQSCVCGGRGIASELHATIKCWKLTFYSSFLSASHLSARVQSHAEEKNKLSNT